MVFVLEFLGDFARFEALFLLRIEDGVCFGGASDVDVFVVMREIPECIEFFHGRSRCDAVDDGGEFAEEPVEFFLRGRRPRDC